jgi:hypothetical protein
VDIRKVDTLPEHPDLRIGQRIKLLIDFYDRADVAENWRPVHRKGDVGAIEGFGIICGQEVVAVEICHHGTASMKVIPVLPTDLEKVPDKTPLTEPQSEKDDIEDLLCKGDKSVIVIDIKKPD